MMTVDSLMSHVRSLGSCVWGWLSGEGEAEAARMLGVDIGLWRAGPHDKLLR